MKLFPARPPGTKVTLRDRLRRLALLGGLALVCLYAAAVTAGYCWLRFGRDNRYVGFLDVAFFQVPAVRRALAAQHLERARMEWETKNFQAAYISFSSALRNDPDNVAGRLEAVRFFRAMGANNLTLTLLEEGLARSPHAPGLIDATFELLLASGRDRYALELLHKRYGTNLSGPEAKRLQSYEVQATLATEGAAAAKVLLDRHGGLGGYAPATPVVARVLWESAERLRAIDLLAAHLESGQATYPDHALLAGWQVAGGRPDQARQTAERACGKFPRNPAARVLLVEMHAAAAPDGRPQPREIESFLKEFAGQPEALVQLATLAGRKGWQELARALYVLGAGSHAEVGLLALCYADALARNSRFPEFQRALAEIEAQAGEDGNAGFLLQIRVRQVLAAGTLRDSDNVREHARRLAASLRSQPDQLETYRRYFLKVGLTEAAAELTSRGPASPAAPLKTAASR